MERRPSLAALLSMAVLLISLSLPGTALAQGQREASRAITVTGTGTAYGTPDIAVVDLGVDSRSPELKTALSDATARMTAIMSALHAAGIPAVDVATTQYAVSFVPAREGSGAGGAASSGAGAATRGYYDVADMASVTIHSLDRTASVLDGVTKAGANRIDGIRFEISDPWKEEAVALDRAYAQAHARALRIAKLAGVTLGAVQRASEEGSPLPEAGPVFRAQAFAAPPVSPGRQGITVTLNVVYSIR